MRQDRQKTLRTMLDAALFTAFAAIISIMEGFLFPTGLFLPGVRLGLSNIATAAAFYLSGTLCAFFTAFLRPLFIFAFTGNSFSLCLSMCGSLLSFASLLISKPFYGKRTTFIGVSALSALFHSIGQSIAGGFLTSGTAFALYFPLFAAASVISGDICGVVMNTVLPRLSKALGRTKITEKAL